MKELNHAIGSYLERLGNYQCNHKLKFMTLITNAAMCAGYDGDLCFIDDETLIDGLQIWEKQLKEIGEKQELFNHQT